MKGKLTKGNLRGVPYAALISASLLLTGVSGAIVAQEESASRLEEVVVTARKREESIQDVPVAVTALTPGQLERGSVASSLDLGKLVPNVELHEAAIGSNSLSASIRGVSYDDIEKSIEATVGVAIDGVFMASNSGAVFDMFDVEAVEVLRGPQGTLFGRNTIGGVINVKRTKPTRDWGAKLEATAGDEDLIDLKAVLNMPLSDRGGLKLALKDISSDSHVYNTTINDRRDYRDSQTASISVTYDVSDRTNVLFTFDDYEHDTTAPDAINTSTWGGDAVSGAPSRNDDYKTSPQQLPLRTSLVGDNMTLIVGHEGDSYDLKYTFGMMDYDEDVYEASWGLPFTLFHVDRFQTYEQTSHEVTLTSDLDGPLNFVAGIYYLETESYITSGPVQNFTTTHEAEASALFGEMTYELSEDWSVTLGARYTEEEKDMVATSWPLCGVAGIACYQETGNLNRALDNRDPAVLLNLSTPNFSDDNISYRAVIQRNFSKGMMYASMSTGFRSGGFFNRGTTAAETLPFQSEEVESIELGIRSEPTDNSQINLTFFTMDYTDKQLTVITGGADPVCGKGTNEGGVTCSFVRNAGEASIDGFEFEGVLLPTENLLLRAAIGTLDGDYDSFDYNGEDIADRARLLYSPELTANFTMEFSTDVGGGELIINGSLSFKDDVNTQADWSTWNENAGPDVVIESFETLDLSATWIRDLGTGTLKLRAYGTDILEEGNRVSRKFDAGSFSWSELVPRRQVGFSVGYDF